jgi:N-acetylglucosaminyldiphosphoundecaprenol N-acetyl-beta-D-mannosaminyltransferase
MIMRPDQIHTARGEMPARAEIGGVAVVPFESYDQALECVEKSIEMKQKSFWVAINPIKIYNAWYSPDLMDLLCKADVGICDGVGVSWASRLLYGRPIKRITGCDLFFKILSLVNQKQWGVFLLGASTQSNTQARLALQRQYPGLRIVGWQDGYFEDSQKVVEQINTSQADFLFVAMGSPMQEEWICRYREAINAQFCMGVGGSFDVAAGIVTRAPRFFRKTGTEFVYRILSEPRKRLAHLRILVHYLLRVIQSKTSGSFPQGDDESIRVSSHCSTHSGNSRVLRSQNMLSESV